MAQRGEINRHRGWGDKLHRAGTWGQRRPGVPVAAATEAPSGAGARVCAHAPRVRASVSAGVGALSRARARAAAHVPPLRRAEIRPHSPARMLPRRNSLDFHVSAGCSARSKKVPPPGENRDITSLAEAPGSTARVKCLYGTMSRVASEISHLSRRGAPAASSRAAFARFGELFNAPGAGEIIGAEGGGG